MNTSLGRLLAIVRRFPSGVISIVCAIALSCAAWVLRAQIVALEALLHERAREGEAMFSLLLGGSTLRQELAATREAAHRIEENLVVPSNLAENLWYFYKLEEQTKARLPELHQLSSSMPNKSAAFRSVPYSLRVTGSYEQVAAFLLALETGPRLLKVTSFSCARVDPRGQALALDLSIELLGKK